MTQTLSPGWEAFLKFQLQCIGEEACYFEYSMPAPHKDTRNVSFIGKKEWEADGGPAEKNWPTRRLAFTSGKSMFVAANNSRVSK
jgi:hypothetical protein